LYQTVHKDLEEAAMNTILVPLDGSAMAERVLPHVRGLASLLGARVCLLTAVVANDYDNILTETLIGAYGLVETPEALQERKQRAWETMRQHAEGYLATQARYLQDSGLDVETEVNFGPPAKIIVEVARERHVTLIAMATHGYSGLKRWTLGSVTDQVVHTATAPVLVVRGADPAPQTDPTIKRILVPLDGSAFARQALPLATELAIRANADLILLEAIAPTIETAARFRPVGRPILQYAEMMELLHWHAQLDLGALAEQLRMRGLHVKTSIVNGHAAEVIVDEAEQRGVDLIVMATHGYSGLKRWALGSVAHKVLHAATMPLVLVRARASADEVGAGAGTTFDASSSPARSSVAYQVLHGASMPLRRSQSIEDEVGVEAGTSQDAR
jgi:nucleotide-binding universal stress UspA family protein